MWWLVQKNRSSLSINQVQNHNQSRVFPQHKQFLLRLRAFSFTPMNRCDCFYLFSDTKSKTLCNCSLKCHATLLHDIPQSSCKWENSAHWPSHLDGAGHLRNRIALLSKSVFLELHHLAIISYTLFRSSEIKIVKKKQYKKDASNEKAHNFLILMRRRQVGFQNMTTKC